MKLLGIPMFAAVLGLVILGAYRLTRNGLVLITGVLWMFYGIYEYLMQIRVLCSGECNIRVDLLLIYPILLIYTIASVFRIARIVWQRRKGRPQGGR